MDGRTQAVLLLALAAVTIRFGLSDAALAYIKPSLQPALLAAGAVLAALGVHGLVRSLGRQTADDHGDDHGDDGDPDAQHPSDDHGHAPGVAWLLMLPLLVLLLVSPPALGSFAAGRQGNAPPEVSDAGFVELPAAREGAVDLGLRDYVTRALYDPDRSLDGVPVRVVGFVVPDDGDRDGYRLSRFTVNCCAADATAYTVEVSGDSGRETDTWLEITGRWQPAQAGDADELPVLVAEQVTPIPTPAEPYEY